MMKSESPQRVLHLPSGHNFRDIGGYPTEHGRSVKWRQVFRSGYMSKIAGEDAAQLHKLGIDTICDLRANDERSERPTLWHEGTATDFWARDHEFSAGSLAELATRPDLKIEHSRDSMCEIYRVLPYEQKGSYSELLGRIARGRIPILFNCSAGKDRTGLATALILSILGVPREVIVEDYLLSNAAVDGLIAFMKSSPKYRALATTRLDLAMPMLRVEADYLDISFDVIENDHGSVERYLADALGIGLKEQEAIRANLLV
jgi:protein-tyrosine phosphatase